MRKRGEKNEREKKQVRRELQNLWKETDANTMMVAYVEGKWIFKAAKDKIVGLS